ncbi:hypothetical protein RD792_017586 [Penstemon davidsonii]|uniref:L-gulonolactone oxidase n=1 Tax=Penstemon davidsonii TaxID=160366 RepID=A0ABR0CMP9_9LAMI|nr:hypothetical protein RD792_017586 [Penstemon davidsonii]
MTDLPFNPSSPSFSNTGRISGVTKLIWLIIFLMIMNTVNSSAPEDPIKCSSSSSSTGVLKKKSNCTITNYIGAFPDRSTCRAAEAFYPTTEAELVSTVAYATLAKKKVKVATRHSHSLTKLVCPDGDEGLVISTKYLDRVLNVNASAMTMTVESGMMLRQLIKEAAKANMALPYSPYWWGLTVGGMLGTGAHGSSLWGLGSQVHDYVIQLRIVSPAGPGEGYAKVRTLENGNPELDAAKVSLGVLGVISQVTLKLQPLFKRSVTYMTKSDSDIGDQAVRFGREHEFGEITWYPSQKQVIYRIDNRVDSSNSTSGNGLFDFLGYRSLPSLVLLALRTNGTVEETREALEDINGKCIDGRLTSTTLRTAAYGLTNDGIGIFMRYVTTSSAYLGKQEDSIDFDITYYRSKDPLAPRLYEDILEEIEQIAMFKYNGLPHWGKNRNVAFIGAINKFENADKFLKIKQIYDPLGLFSSKWTDQVLGLNKDGLSIMKEGCALEGLCICSEDVHCAPKMGYFCRPGKVYGKARVCAKQY